MKGNQISIYRKIVKEVKRELFDFKRRRNDSKLYARDELNNPGEYYSIKAFDYYECVFIHIPKAAGISVSKTLFGNLAGGHRKIGYYQNYYSRSTFRRYFKFSFVRNPWSRLYSAYNFLKCGVINTEDEAFSDKYLRHCNSFEEFVLERLRNPSILQYCHFVPQYKYICDKKKNIMVDFVGRFECINDDFQYIQKKIKNDSCLMHINKSSDPKSSYSDFYSKKMKDSVSRVYTNDIRMFGYEF